MKAFAKTIMIICLILLALVVVINAVKIEIPEGEEPTKAQQFLIDVKNNADLIAGALGTTTSAIAGFLYVVIQKTSTITNDNTAKIVADVLTTNTKLENITAEQLNSRAANAITEKKLDMLMQILSETLLLSDLPVSVREKINTAKDVYNGLGAKTADTEQIIETDTNTAQNQNVDVVKPQETKNATAEPKYF